MTREPRLPRLVLICLSSIAAAQFGTPTAQADQANAGALDQTAVRGTPRTDRNSQLAHVQLVEKARQGGIDLYFAGDSITRRWGTSDPK